MHEFHIKEMCSVENALMSLKAHPISSHAKTKVQPTVMVESVEFLGLLEDLGSSTRALRSRYHCLPCLPDEKDTPKKLSGSINFYNSFPEDKIVSCCYRISQNDLKTKKREFDLVCSADS